MKRHIRLIAGAILVGMTTMGPADASIPVIDVAALQQLIQDAMSWQRQLQAMKSQLAQLQQTRTALTGSRGMEKLLRQSTVDLHYLPGDWAELQQLENGGVAANPELATRIRGLVASNARLSDAQLARVDPSARATLINAREIASTHEALTQIAYEHSSGRFAAISQLIDRIGSTGDAKAIAELQGRIAAEQAMLENEAVRLHSLAYAAEANRASAEVARREEVIRGHGNFATRFQPTLPAP